MDSLLAQFSIIESNIPNQPLSTIAEAWDKAIAATGEYLSLNFVGRATWDSFRVEKVSFSEIKIRL